MQWSAAFCGLHGPDIQAGAHFMDWLESDIADAFLQRLQDICCSGLEGQSAETYNLGRVAFRTPQALRVGLIYTASITVNLKPLRTMTFQMDTLPMALEFSEVKAKKYKEKGNRRHKQRQDEYPLQRDIVPQELMPSIPTLAELQAPSEEHKLEL
eukprot:TRINITY_DN36577_c0_g2_i1.p2 TRINITY_DN36577_c0_g2~~TRINITY_DN36577_c0_g2_i1.p2  ORF type:complete len:155 (+),score=23.74 TRINITY_DN36577_c0_g2_i1:1161-1625(+)